GGLRADGGGDGVQRPHAGGGVGLGDLARRATRGLRQLHDRHQRITRSSRWITSPGPRLPSLASISPECNPRIWRRSSASNATSPRASSRPSGPATLTVSPVPNAPSTETMPLASKLRPPP